jgi:Peptidase M15
VLWILFSIVSLVSTSPAAAERTPPAASSLATSEPGPGNTADRRAGFELRAGGEPIPFDVMAAFVLPGEELPLAVTSADSSFEVGGEAGELRATGPNLWTWRAPLTPGAYPVRVAREDGSAAVTLNVFVMVPYDRMEKGVLGGYRIGAYPQRWKPGLAGYDRPRGFVEVNAATEGVQVAPHFTLGQFVCKEGKGFPKYLVLRPTLLVKLERLLEVAKDHGMQASTFRLMSAYRTPVYNRGIGNTTTFSRHQYGDAADIFVDEFPADGVMDDLNRDGRGDRGDARLLSSWAEEIDRAPGDDALVGGLSAYGSTEAHGPFVHVDARGYPARW